MRRAPACECKASRGSTSRSSPNPTARRDRYEAVRAKPAADPLAPGDVAGLMARLERDFGNGYFITGVIDE